jgi:diguanylate cyclase (GGDEF)-like protein/PAS domain S-box-containing protein
MHTTLDHPAVAHESLEERLAVLRPGLDELGLAACILDPELRYRYVNAQYAAFAGRDVADFADRTPNQVFAQRPQDDRRERMQRALAGEAVVFYREQIEGPSAGRWLRAHYMPLRGRGSEVLGVLVVLVDVQELKETERALAERERQLSLIMDSVGFPITYIDRRGVIRFANQPSCEWSGRTPETMIGWSMADIAPAAVLAAVKPLYDRAFSGESVTYEREALWPGREKRRVRGHLIPDKDASGEVRGILSVLMDIDEDHKLREQLVDQRKQLQLVIDNIGVPLSYIDRDRRFRFANQPGHDWQLASPGEALGRRLDEVYDAEAIKVIQPEVDRAFRGEKRVYERLGTPKKGDPRWMRIHLVPDVGPDGEVMGVYSLVIDVDDDHRLREALQEQEARLRFFAENIPGPIAVVDSEFRYVFANKHFQRLRGFTLDQIVGRPVREVLGPEAAGLFLEPFVERLRRGETCAYERLVGPPGSEPRWHLVRLAPIIDPEGRFNGYYIVGSDIHDIKLAEEKLREREAQLRLYTDNIPDSVAYLDRNRVIRFVNKHFAEQRGIPPEDLVGKTTSEALGPEVAAWIAQRTQKVLDRGEVATYERLVELPGGVQHWFHVKAVPHFDESGSGLVRGMYVVAHDINEVKEAQEKLAAREEELRFFAENIPEAIVYIDLERGCTFINNVFLRTRGISRESALGKFPDQVYSPEVMAEVGPQLERVLLGEEVVYERLVRMPSGDERWIRVRLTPRHDANGVVRGYYVVSTDIHDIKSAQALVEDKERQLRQVIDSIPTPMVYVDPDFRYRYVNDAFLDYVGLPQSRVIGETVRAVLGEERYGALAPFLERVQRGETLSMERLLRFADGRTRWMTVRLTPRLAEGRFLGYYATTSDIHEQKMVEEELRRASSVLSAHFDNTPLAVIEWDTELRVVRWSGHAEAIFGWPASDALGRALAGWRLVFEDDEAAVGAMIRGLMDGAERHATLLHRNYRKDGSVIWVEWHNSALRDENGRVISILSLAQDVSSRMQAEERLQYMATHDGLTGLPNNVLLNDRLQAALMRAHRARRRVGVMFLDLDHFKDVNDSLGHRIGDGLLKELSNRIRGALRQSDVLARISGDEFVVVLEDLPDEGAPERVARKILEEVRRPFVIEGHEIHVSGSLGLALHPEDGLDAETLLKNADAAMYHAKELGRNSYRLFSAELAARRTEKLQIEIALRRALREGELALHFQPIVDVGTRDVRRAEALLRWHDPERGLMLPGGFIPLADETGLGHAVGHWVLETACRQARAWRDSGVGDITVCVNLTAAQLRDTTMITDLKRILARTGCEPRWLQFEITETSMVRDVEGASVVLAKLRGLGVRIAIDDFGTGFSSLSHLRHLPVDVLKIDKAFVADIDPAGRKKRDVSGGAAIASAVIGLARGLGLDVVAEGVERDTQLDFLKRAGCPAFQGYLFCPPLPAEEFERWLREWRKPESATRKSKRARRPAASRKSPPRRRATRRRS